MVCEPWSRRQMGGREVNVGAHCIYFILFLFYFIQIFLISKFILFFIKNKYDKIIKIQIKVYGLKIYE